MNVGRKGTLITGDQKRPAVVVAMTKKAFLVEGCKGLGGRYWILLKDGRALDRHDVPVSFIPKVKLKERI